MAGINISRRSDVLVWGGHIRNDWISVKETYDHITSTSQAPPFSDITSMLWKWEVPLKIKCFSWLAIRNCILTWDNLDRRGFFGPSWCCLCRQDSEDFLHLFIRTPFAVEIWARVATILGVPQINDAPSILECFRLWNSRAKAHRTLPLYVLWGIWHARNAPIFEGILPVTITVAMDIDAFFKEIGPWTPKYSLQTVSYVDLSNIFPICCFDGASFEGNCKCGVSLHLDLVVHYHSTGMVVGGQLQSQTECVVGALQCSSWLGIDNFLIIGDSLVLINWIQGRCSLKVPTLCNWIELIHNILPSFSAVSFQHVFREQNMEADALSKAGLSLCPGFMFFEKLSASRGCGMGSFEY